MPTYQYACTACGERSEAVQSFTDAPLTECSACGGALRKVFSSVGVVFKGSGFYKTDSRKAPADSGAKSSGDSGSSGDGGGDSKSADAKPAAAKTGDGSSTSGDKSTTPRTGSTSASSSTPASKTA